MAIKHSAPITLSYKCIRGQRDEPVRVLNEASFSMAEYNERTGRFTWLRVLPITQREAVEKWVQSQLAAHAPASKAATLKMNTAKAG